MRKVIYGAACSLDGFITGPDGTIDWLHFSRDVQEIMAKSMRGVDAFLMGRVTWEVARKMEPEGRRSTPGRGPRTYLFSRTVRPEDAPPGVTVVADDAGGFVRRLKQEPGGSIVVMGGGVLGQSLFEAGVIDEVGLNIHPVLLGSGTPLFRDAGRRVQLELLESRVLDGGCVLANYRVTG